MKDAATIPNPTEEVNKELGSSELHGRDEI